MNERGAITHDSACFCKDNARFISHFCTHTASKTKPVLVFDPVLASSNFNRWWMILKASTISKELVEVMTKFGIVSSDIVAGHIPNKKEP